MGLFRPVITKAFPSFIPDVLGNLAALTHIVYHHAWFDVESLMTYTEGAILAVTSNGLLVGILTEYGEVPIDQAITQASYLTTALGMAVSALASCYQIEIEEEEEEINAVFFLG
jgi:hypothetical protein